MHNIADNLRSEEIEDGSDEECQILGVFKPLTSSLLRTSVISGRKRPAVDSQSSPSVATAIKHPASQVTDKELEWPVPMTSESLVQSSVLTTELMSMLVSTNQQLPQVPGCSIHQLLSCSTQQPIRSCISNGPQCIHGVSVPSCHFPMCSCSSLARPIAMRPSVVMSSHNPAQSSCNPDELSVSSGLETNPPQPSSPPQQWNNSSTLPSHLLHQTFQPCTSSPFIRTACAHTSTLPTNHLIASSSYTIPVNSPSPPQTNHTQEENFEQPRPSSQDSNISSIIQPNHENISETGDNSPIHEAQAVLDLSSPQQEQWSRNHATVMEKQPIWQGTLHYEEKAANISDPNVSHYLACTLSTLLNTTNDFDLDVNLWPVQMSLSLIASEILKEKNMFEVLKGAAHHVVIDFHEKSPALKRIKRNMHHGWMGCVQFTTPRDVRIMIVLYMPQKKVYVGFLPHEQKVFFNTFRHVYEKKRRIRNLQKELEAAANYIASDQPSSSSVSTSIELNEQSRNQFQDIDNEIEAHISALHRQHQENQPSTFSPQPGPSNDDSNQSIEARLKRLEAAQKRNTRNVNEYEEIDNEINAKIAAHWLHHYAQDATTSNSQLNAYSPLPNISYTNPSTLLHERVQTVLDRIPPMLWKPDIPWWKSPRVRPYYGLQQSTGTVSGRETHTASPIAQSSQETVPSVDESVVEMQASEIFDKELIKNVVHKTFTLTGKRFHTVEELCDAILKFEESKPKPVEKKSKKEVSEELLCKICLDERLNIVFEPCGHLATCQECSQSLTKCPMCRSIVKRKMRIYM